MYFRFRPHFIIAAILLFAGLCSGADQHILWQIGTSDNDTADLALGPADHAQYSRRFAVDPVFVIGQSDARKHWPYVQPGPADTWAESKPHSYTILFGLQSRPSAGACSLTIDLVDTHSSIPPKLDVRINDWSSQLRTPQGAGDDSAHGQAHKGREFKTELVFPSTVLKQGNNTVGITSVSGSWILYDSVHMSVPQAVGIVPVQPMTKLLDVSTEPYLVKGPDGGLQQPIIARFHRIGEAQPVALIVNGRIARIQSVEQGMSSIEIFHPAVATDTEIQVQVQDVAKTIGNKTLTLKPVRKWVIYLLHHTHLDIGYTHVQTEVEQMQWRFLDQAIDLGKKTAGNPPEARFKWLPEGLWAVDSYYQNASPEKRRAFIEAIQQGTIGLDALYGNELTALCRPEELMELVGLARRFSREHDVTIDSAMITDVPGYTWGMVPVLAQSGVKYLSIGPNFGHRIGYTLSTWGDKPFYWQSPSGQERILCWMAGMGYSWFHTGLNYKALQSKLKPERFFNYLTRLVDSDYPYDMVQVRYNIGSDNGPPDPNLPDFVKNWNRKYAYPQMIIASPSRMFADFAGAYGAGIPTVTGDFTPYWEDGAASSARETVQNRRAAERLVQAQVMSSLLNPQSYPAEAFHQAWREVLLYDEHTWGSYNSISEPEGAFTQSQWKIKQAFAHRAQALSHELLQATVKPMQQDGPASKVLVFNTLSWPRENVVHVRHPAGSVVRDETGSIVPSQRLQQTDALVFQARVPALGATRYSITQADRETFAGVSVDSTGLSNGLISLKIDPKTGAIKSLCRQSIDNDFAANSDDVGLNDFFYVAGRDPKSPERNDRVTVTVLEEGPLLGKLAVTCKAPGCKALVRHISLHAGSPQVMITNILDRENVYEQEGLHFAYDFNVTDGTVRMETPWAVVRPELDQLAGACKNYFTVQRWVDASNAAFGITLATPDAPLIEIGSITNDPRSSVGWIKRLAPSTRVYSYVMNNYWETNYKASQPGKTSFNYALLPHGAFDQAAATRFGMEQGHPLIVVPADQNSRALPSLFELSTDDIIASTVKPADQGRDLIVRLYNPTGKAKSVSMTWHERAPQIWLSNPAEEKIAKADMPLKMPPYQIVTLRVQSVY
jgi:alpha-mannosidase